MRRTVKKNRTTALFLAMTLVLSAAETGGLWQMEAMASQTGREEADEEIRITTGEEFLDFGRNCVSETYSKGKTFILETDIDLQGKDFQPIPVFAGIFEGNGHGIIGLSIHDAGSGLGLFRYVQEGAEIKNLRVQGTVQPEGSRKNTGGIAGVNRGLIEGCTFGGLLTGQEALGGIAGYNEETGIIRNCENQAVLTGNLKTGGIAGVSEGLIEDCVNRGEINGTDQKVEDQSGSQFSLNSIDLEDSIRVERVNDGGGIAGFSQGIIRGCTNYGKVGYPHMGYNLGGIAGRQSGLIEGCTNQGTIRGRKDVGGITGQFEPCLTVKYEEDMFGSLESQMDRLSQMGDSMSRLIEEAGDTASGNLDRIDEQLGKIKDIGRFYKNIYKEGGDEFDRDADRSLDEIQRILDHMELRLSTGETRRRISSAKETLSQMKRLREEMKKGYEGDVSDVEALKKWLEQRRRQMEELSRYGDQLKEDIAYIAVHAPGDAAEGAENFGDDLEDLQVEANGLIDVIRINGDKLKNDLDSMDEELTAELDALSGDMDALSDGLKDSKSQIRDQKDQIQDQIDQIRDTISEGVDRAREEKDLFEDISDLEAQEPEAGMIIDCVNEGAVSADFQAGGIAGIIGIEAGLDPEQDLEAEEERTLNVTRNIRAIVSNCVNRQQIQVKNDYAGGIAGKANLGALIGNQNYGDVSAEDGNYAGGITGSSAYVLRNNYNMCTISGNDYIGGIAGWGTDMLGNYSMVSFENMGGEWRGTVAGSADEEGLVEGNFYVEEGLGAVDGITYEGQAQGLTYEAFRNLEQMPEEFGRLTVEFLVEDQVLKTVICQYGDSVPSSEIPQVPKKDGYYYVWEEKDLSCIKGNEKVRAIYRAWNTTIASSDDKMPLMLAEADFYPGTSLTLEERPAGYGENQIPDGYLPVKAYAYSIRQPEGVAGPEMIRLHVLAEGCSRSAVLGIVRDGEIRITESRWDGDYLGVEMDGVGELVILEREKPLPLWIAAAAAVLVLGLLILAAGRRKKGKKRRRSPESEAAGAAGDSRGSENTDHGQESGEQKDTASAPKSRQDGTADRTEAEKTAGETPDSEAAEERNRV